MSIRDYYLALIEKTANAAEGDGEHESIPKPDNIQSATTDHDRIMEDSRYYLHSLFSQAGAVQSNQSAELKKMFSMPASTITSNPLIKVAFRDAFFNALNNAPVLKTASSIHREISFNSFIDELEKIGGLSPAKALPDVSRAVLKVAPHPVHGMALSGSHGTNPARMPLSRNNPNPLANTAKPLPQTSLGSGAVDNHAIARQWGGERIRPE